jgi:hypothetical protein
LTIDVIRHRLEAVGVVRHPGSGECRVAQLVRKL